MKKELLAAALCLTFCAPATAQNAVLDNIATRASVRQFKSEPVEKDKITQILKAAMSAPSAMNKQPPPF